MYIYGIGTEGMSQTTHNTFECGKTAIVYAYHFNSKIRDMLLACQELIQQFCDSGNTKPCYLILQRKSQNV
jgi:hypothetical protein